MNSDSNPFESLAKSCRDLADQIEDARQSGKQIDSALLELGAGLREAADAYMKDTIAMAEAAQKKNTETAHD